MAIRYSQLFCIFGAILLGTGCSDSSSDGGSSSKNSGTCTLASTVATYTLNSCTHYSKISDSELTGVQTYGCIDREADGVSIVATWKDDGTCTETDAVGTCEAVTYDVSGTITYYADYTSDSAKTDCESTTNNGTYTAAED